MGRRLTWLTRRHPTAIPATSDDAAARACFAWSATSEPLSTLWMRARSRDWRGARPPRVSARRRARHAPRRGRPPDEARGSTRTTPAHGRREPCRCSSARAVSPGSSIGWRSAVWWSAPRARATGASCTRASPTRAGASSPRRLPLLVAGIVENLGRRLCGHTRLTASGRAYVRSSPLTAPPDWRGRQEPAARRSRTTDHNDIWRPSCLPAPRRSSTPVPTSVTCTSRSPTSSEPSAFYRDVLGFEVTGRARRRGRLSLGRRLPPPHRPEHLGVARRLAAAARLDRPVSRCHPVSDEGGARPRAARAHRAPLPARRCGRPRRQRGSLPPRPRRQRHRAVLGPAA